MNIKAARYCLRDISKLFVKYSVRPSVVDYFLNYALLLYYYPDCPDLLLS